MMKARKSVSVSESLRRYIDAVYLLDAVAQRVPNDAWEHASWYVKSIGSLAVGDGPIAAEAEAAVLGA